MCSKFSASMQVTYYMKLSMKTWFGIHKYEEENKFAVIFLFEVFGIFSYFHVFGAEELGNFFGMVLSIQ